MADERPVYGLLAEFEDEPGLLAAVNAVVREGYRKVDAFTPFPVEGLAEALGHRTRFLPWVVLGGAVLGGLFGYGLQYYVSVLHYPLNVGGRPLNSWPAFIPVTFELTILGGALAAVLGMLALNGLPRPYHPLFGAPGFERVTDNGFFLCVEADDPLFELERTRAVLADTRPLEVTTVEAV